MRIDSIEQGVCPATSKLTATIHPRGPSRAWQVCCLERLTSPALYWATSNGREELPEFNVVTRHHDRIGGNAMPESEAMRKIRRERVRKMAELLKIRYDKLRELRRPVSRRRAQRWADPSSCAARDSKRDRDLH